MLYGAYLYKKNHVMCVAVVNSEWVQLEPFLFIYNMSGCPCTLLDCIGAIEKFKSFNKFFL